MLFKLARAIFASLKEFKKIYLSVFPLKRKDSDLETDKLQIIQDTGPLTYYLVTILTSLWSLDQTFLQSGDSHQYPDYESSMV